MEKEKSYWFAAKSYGWGWGLPYSWQGWTVLALFLMIVMVLPFVLDPAKNLLLYCGVMGGVTVLLLTILFAKGEPPKWRWGKKKNG